MFAGPNGSGKSVLKSYLPPALLGVYINPDEIEAAIRLTGQLDTRPFGIETSANEILSFFANSPLLRDEWQSGSLEHLHFLDGFLRFGAIGVHSYMASTAADFLRTKLLESRQTFTVETVMSHGSKINLLSDAQAAGYRTYLYYVATEAAEINVSRVANRVALGGHSVPEERIISRYDRSLDLLLTAIRSTHRAYIFDNSTDNADHRHTWLAEITDGRVMELKTDRIPNWFQQAVLAKIA